MLCPGNKGRKRHRLPVGSAVADGHKERGDMILSLGLRLQHCLNALHIYARLCRRMPPRKARKIALLYEILIHPLLYLTNGIRK